jgi:hypothetical protein
MIAALMSDRRLCEIMTSSRRVGGGPPLARGHRRLFFASFYLELLAKFGSRLQFPPPDARAAWRSSQASVTPASFACPTEINCGSSSYPTLGPLWFCGSFIGFANQTDRFCFVLSTPLSSQ